MPERSDTTEKGVPLSLYFGCAIGPFCDRVKQAGFTSDVYDHGFGIIASALVPNHYAIDKSSEV